jgi:hypothetical protein
MISLLMRNDSDLNRIERVIALAISTNAAYYLRVPYEFIFEVSQCWDRLTPCSTTHGCLIDSFFHHFSQLSPEEVIFDHSLSHVVQWDSLARTLHLAIPLTQGWTGNNKLRS